VPPFEPLHGGGPVGCGTIDGVTGRGVLLVARLHVDLSRVSSAACRASR
jgi:hypothetical protein